MMNTRLRLTPLVSALASAFALGLTAGAAQAQTAAAAAVAAAPDTPDAQRVVIVQGRGQVRSVQGVTAAEFSEAPAGTSPLVTVSRLPGVNFQSADPLGNYEWSTRFTVRGFSQNQLGFTLDDVPLGDMSYSNFNGLHISRAIASENVGRAFLSQGSGALDTASSSNLGGTLQFYSVDPSDKFGVELHETVGSDKLLRSYASINTGDTGHGRLMLSIVKQNADKWKGEGQQRQQQVNAKYLIDTGSTRFSAFVNTSSRREMDYQDMSYEMINRLGRNWDNFYPDFQAAIDASNKYCGNNGSTYVAQCDDAYYAGAGLRDDTLMGATLDATVNDKLRVKTTLYHHTDNGRGLWFTPYTASVDAAQTPVSLRTTEYAINRTGVTATATLTLGAHDIKAGVWFEGNAFDQARRFYNATLADVPSPYIFPANPFYTQWQYRFNTTTEQFSLSDTFQASDALTLSAGFKSLDVNTDGELLVGSGKPSGSIAAKKNFLPQAGLNYQLSKTDELFASLARNMRAYQAAATGTTPWATTADGFKAIQGSLKPETSDSFEAGWRTSAKGYEGTLTAYLVNFHDRLLGVQKGAGIAGNATILSNVGGVRSVGVEASLSLRVTPTLTWYNSLSQASSTYRSDVVSDGVTYAVSGKHVVDAPNTMLKSVLGYDDGALFGNATVDYMSKRYYSYLNDASVNARTVLNLSGGYRVKALGLIKEASLQGSINNVANLKYVSTIGSNGFVNSDSTGTAQTLLVAPPRQFMLTLAAKF